MYLTSIKNLHLNVFSEKLENKKVFQPELSSYIFYGLNELFEIDRNICNKFFKKEVLIKALNSITKSYSNIYSVFSEDSLRFLKHLNKI